MRVKGRTSIDGNSYVIGGELKFRRTADGGQLEPWSIFGPGDFVEVTVSGVLIQIGDEFYVQTEKGNLIADFETVERGYRNRGIASVAF